MPTFDRIAKLQASLFVSGMQWGSPGKANIKLRGLFRPELELNPLPIQIPIEAPAEVPRFIMFSPEGTWQCMISLLRIDLQAVSQTLESLEPLTAGDVDKFWSTAPGKLCEFVEKFEVDVTRLAAVAEYMASPDPDTTPVQFVRNRLFAKDLSPELGGDLVNAEFHSHKVRELTLSEKPTKVNQWVRIKATATKNQTPMLTAEVDMNTVAGPPHREYDVGSIREFFAIAKTRLPELNQLASSI